MNFLQRIKDSVNDPKNRCGSRDNVMVDVRSLRELIEHFERLDSTERALHPSSRQLEIEHQLHYLIEAAYHRQSKDAETTLMLVMDTLRPLMEQRHKDRKAVFGFGG